MRDYSEKLVQIVRARDGVELGIDAQALVYGRMMPDRIHPNQEVHDAMHLALAWQLFDLWEQWWQGEVP